MSDIKSTQDICDNGRCSAPATVEVELKTGVLVFCGHHYRDKMKSQAFKGVLISCSPLKVKTPA